MSTASSSSFTSKDRKRSAHWTDQDTETLVNLLLRNKVIGRTADNGFKPEIWEEAAMLLEGNTYMGGPKTADACKSRWQRLQRDYKAAKDMEAMPGFSWDRNTNRLSASPECWTNAEKQLDSYKYRKIHLPTFDSIAILCSNLGDPNKTRPRAQKGRTSLGSISNASSMLSLSTQTTASTSTSTTGPSQASNSANPIQSQVLQGQVNTNGHDQGQDDSAAMLHLHQQMPDQHQNHNDQTVFNWTNSTHNGHAAAEVGEEDGEGEFDNAFNLSDGSQSFNMGHKRPLPFDPSLLSPAISTNQNHGPGPAQNIHPQHTLPMPQGSPPKKSRLSRSQAQNQQIHTLPAPMHAHAQPQAQIHHIHQQLPPAHIIPQQFYIPHPHPHQPHPHSHPQHHHQIHPNAQIQSHPQPQTQNEMSIPSNRQSMKSLPHSPEFSTSTTLIDHQLVATPPPSATNPILRQYTPNSNSLTSHSNHNHNPMIPSSQSATSLHSLSLPAELSGSNLDANSSNKSGNAKNGDNDATAAPKSSGGGGGDHGQLSESQRRTNAIIQIQNLQETLELKDEELIEIIVEFEQNVSAADTFLAIQKDHLRKMWLSKIVKRRNTGGGRKK
ncbi:uncharacterized protein I303_107396 [Kwoniella dejecticola CBS 10117]|uniref:Myb-like domain-containing protein n=1 Tax=Kwoniella dejecticola CBS 10117 TaxID=1296121 RepID=A0A1A5ZZK4_9TREE|nr:uncharacterized protein I303_06800 [Kwoniella dejecticola CBS 10117]OBR83239.1 hypothetical protein I303_06800 [Kwoniella dejecticola CBS 10117]